ncbi:hypothetical protein H6775_02505 [Candidatus Nomurabacteria bacterium]|nr:hypothetical protein [Candidatus Nomurabacteria bacterium]
MAEDTNFHIVPQQIVGIGNQVNGHNQVGIILHHHRDYLELLGINARKLEAQELFFFTRSLGETTFPHVLLANSMMKIHVRIWLPRHDETKMLMDGQISVQGKVTAKMAPSEMVLCTLDSTPVKIPDWIRDIIGRDTPDDI